MRAVVSRVSSASVVVGGELVGAIGPGLLALVGVANGDSEADADTLATKLAGLRIFDDGHGRMNRSVSDVGGGVLVVSQFTLLADTRKGRRPSWNAAAPADVAEPVVARVVEALRARGVTVATGLFGAHMDIELVADGPVTIVCPIGGGGLVAGVALWASAREDVRVIGVESEASATMRAALDAGRIVPVDERETIADGLAGNLEPGSVTFELVRRHVSEVVLAKVSFSSGDLGFGLMWAATGVGSAAGACSPPAGSSRARRRRSTARRPR